MDHKALVELNNKQKIPNYQVLREPQLKNTFVKFMLTNYQVTKLKELGMKNYFHEQLQIGEIKTLLRKPGRFYAFYFPIKLKHLYLKQLKLMTMY